MKKLLLFAAAYAALSSLTLFAMEDSIYVEQPETKTEAATSKKKLFVGLMAMAYKKIVMKNIMANDLLLVVLVI